MRTMCGAAATESETELVSGSHPKAKMRCCTEFGMTTFDTEDIMKCGKCGGLMAYEKFYSEVEDLCGWRCIACGEIIDQVVLENRHKQKS